MVSYSYVSHNVSYSSSYSQTKAKTKKKNYVVSSYHIQLHVSWPESSEPQSKYKRHSNFKVKGFFVLQRSWFYLNKVQKRKRYQKRPPTLRGFGHPDVNIVLETANNWICAILKRETVSDLIWVKGLDNLPQLLVYIEKIPWTLLIWSQIRRDRDHSWDVYNRWL